MPGVAWETLYVLANELFIFIGNGTWWLTVWSYNSGCCSLLLCDNTMQLQEYSQTSICKPGFLFRSLRGGTLMRIFTLFPLCRVDSLSSSVGLLISCTDVYRKRL